MLNSICVLIYLAELSSLDKIKNTRFNEELDIVVNNFDYYNNFDINDRIIEN